MSDDGPEQQLSLQHGRFEVWGLGVGLNQRMCGWLHRSVIEVSNKTSAYVTFHHSGHLLSAKHCPLNKLPTLSVNKSIHLGMLVHTALCTAHP